MPRSPPCPRRNLPSAFHPRRRRSTRWRWHRPTLVVRSAWLSPKPLAFGQTPCLSRRSVSARKAVCCHTSVTQEPPSRAPQPSGARALSAIRSMCMCVCAVRVRAMLSSRDPLCCVLRADCRAFGRASTCRFGEEARPERDLCREDALRKGGQDDRQRSCWRGRQGQGCGAAGS